MKIISKGISKAARIFYKFLHTDGQQLFLEQLPKAASVLRLAFHWVFIKSIFLVTFYFSLEECFIISFSFTEIMTCTYRWIKSMFSFIRNIYKKDYKHFQKLWENARKCNRFWIILWEKSFWCCTYSLYQVSWR